MAIHMPPVRANDGWQARRTSMSGVAEVSSRQKLISSAITASRVRPRTERKDCACTAMTTPLRSLISLAVSDMTSSASILLDIKKPRT